MSSSTSSRLTFIEQQITIYGGFIVIIAGVFGNLLNILVFLSLKTFRKSSCAFYLTLMSIFNLSQLVFGLFSRIMITGYGIDWTTTSLFYCKSRISFTQLCSLMSYACLCLATIDQYFATCSRPHWQQWSNIKLARRLIIISLIVSIILSIPYPIYFNHVTLATGQISCTMTNVNMLQYRNYFVVLFLEGHIPNFVTVIFGILAYRNIQQIVYRRVPLVRRELDKQLTIMVLVQVIINLFTNIPCITMVIIIYATVNITDRVFLGITQFIYSVILIIFYTYFAGSFYIYICVSQRFRRQLIHVFCVIHLDGWQQRRININQVVPT